MVVEREPPKSVAQSPQRPSQPEFGKPSPLRSRIQSSRDDVFIIPKPQQPRPEHHRATQGISTHLPHASQLDHKSLYRPVAGGIAPAQPHNSKPYPTNLTSSSASSLSSFPPVAGGLATAQPYTSNAYPIDLTKSPASTFSSFRPAVGGFSAVQPQNSRAYNVDLTKPPVPTFSSFRAASGGFTAVNPNKQGYQVDLTQPEDPYNLDAGLLDTGFGAADPYTYIDAGKATENIKALLEGAFEDDEDKPRTRSRKKKAVSGLANKLENLDVNVEQKMNAGCETEEGEGDDVEADEEEEEEEEADDGTVEGLNVKLLPHQVGGVEWMKDKEIGLKKKNGILPKGGILADDMGLGKTIQSIALILTNPRPGPSTDTSGRKTVPKDVERCTLVVAPLALIKQWEAEIKNRVSNSHRLRVCVHHGGQRTKNFQDLRKYDVVVTTYQILVSEHGSSSEDPDGLQVGCFGLHWYRVILDEAHTVKNRNAKATKACYALRAEYRWCLTGTPMQNNLDEIQSLIKFLRIKPYDDLSVWKNQITKPMNNGRGGVAIRRLQVYLRIFMKRRTKDVLKQEGALNPGGKTEGQENGFKITERKIENIAAEFSPEERKFYDKLEKRADKSLEQMMDGHKINYASALVLLLRLRQACNHPHLVGGSMAKDQDALTTGQGTLRKSKAVDKDLDDVADILGALSMETKKCDVCQLELEKDEVASGAIRCLECNEGLAVLKREKKFRAKQKRWKKKPAAIARSKKPQPQMKQNRRVIPDDSEEDGDNEQNSQGADEAPASVDYSGEDEDEEQEENGSQSSSEELATEDEEDSEESTTLPFIKSAKIRHLIAILHSECKKHKVIVFSQFTSMLDLIEPFLRKESFIFTRYDGSMRNDLREASLERLRTHAQTRILLCSLKCGSLGLNLTAASRVVILEPFWNPFIEEQAIDRVHRLNQTVDVVVYKLTIANSVEERILALQEKKRALAEAAIEGKSAAKLSMEDILNLFRRDDHHAVHSDEGDLGLKVGVLRKEDSVSTALGMAAGNRARERYGGSKEDAVYGRRW